MAHRMASVCEVPNPKRHPQPGKHVKRAKRIADLMKEGVDEDHSAIQIDGEIHVVIDRSILNSDIYEPGSILMSNDGENGPLVSTKIDTSI